MRKFFALALCAALTACATTPAGNPQATVFAVKQQYALALEVAVAYDNLPPCVTGVKAVCSTVAGRQSIKKAKDAASVAIDSAESAVRNPDFSASTQNQVVVSANAALVALNTILSQLKK